jgi:outer membrane protein assembly factor BamA
VNLWLDREVRSLGLLALAACGSTTTRVAIHAPTCTAEVADAPSFDLVRWPAGAKVARVEIVSRVSVDAASTLQTKPGTELDNQNLRDDVRTLWKLGMASQISVSAEPGSDGYAVAFTIEPPQRVRGVELDGVTRAQVPTLAVLEGSLDDGARLERMTSGAQGWLRDHGYLHAELVANRRADCGGIVVHVTGKLGQRYTLARISIHGSGVEIGSGELETELGRVNAVGGVLQMAGLESTLASILDRNIDAGFFEATYQPMVIHTNDKSGTLTVDVTFKAGQRYRMGELQIDGGTPAMRAVALAELRPLRGQWYDARRVRIAREHIAMRVADLGGDARGFSSKPHDHRYDVKISLVEAKP